MYCERNLTNNPPGSRQDECKLSKKQRRVIQKQLKLRNTLARHENIICSESATTVCHVICCHCYRTDFKDTPLMKLYETIYSAWMKANRLQLNTSKPKSSGALHCGVIIRSRLTQFESATHQSCRCFQFGILVSILTPTSLRGLTSLPSSDHVSRHFDRSGVYSVLYHDTPC